MERSSGGFDCGAICTLEPGNTFVNVAYARSGKRQAQRCCVEFVEVKSNSRHKDHLVRNDMSQQIGSVNAIDTAPDKHAAFGLIELDDIAKLLTKRIAKRVHLRR